jgi:DNA-binding transcriptional MerR regulator/thioredoxin-like negative regulator of GroEL
MTMSMSIDTAQTSTSSEHLYSVADVARLFELPESRVRYWSQTGFITPSVRQSSRRFYSFRDLISIKVAKELLDAGLPLQRVRRSLDALRMQLPELDAPLARLRIRSDRERILVDEGQATYEAVSGQLLLDFDVDKLRTQVAEVLVLPFGRSEPLEPTPSSAYEEFARALACEQQWDGRDPQAPQLVEARAAYERAIELDGDFAAAWTNLGSLLAFQGEQARARDCFDEALRADPGQPEAQCNLAELALQDGEFDLAARGFRTVLRKDPEHLEAHYGLARSLLELGGKGQALAHLERFCAAVDRLPRIEQVPELMRRREHVEQVIDLLRRELG